MKNIAEPASSQNVGDFLTHNEWIWILPNPIRQTLTNDIPSFLFSLTTEQNP